MSKTILKHNTVLNKLYLIFLFTTIILTGILTGFMISHSIMLGRFFTWYIESGNVDLLRQTFAVFRASNRFYDFLYDSFLYLNFVSGLIWLALAILLKRDRIMSLIPGLSTFLIALIFSISDLDEAEEAVLWGTASESLNQLFVSINVPLHTSFAIIYFFSFLILLYLTYKNSRMKDIKQ